MRSRILPLAVAIAAVVACGRGSAAAADDKAGTANDQATVSFAEFVSPEPAPAAITITDNESGIAYDGPNYKTDLCWDGGQVCFSDLFVPATGRTVNDMPIMDGASWSSPLRRAGIYFMESIPGIGLNCIKCHDPKNVVKGNNTVSCEWDDQYGYRSFRMNMDEHSVTITGYDPASGQPIDNWFLSLITAREKGNDLPFTVIVPDKINSEYKGHEYHLGLSTGKAALNRDDTPPVFNIYPENGTITLTFDSK